MPDGKVGHDAYAVIRETIRSLDKVALARVVLTNREHVIALEARDKGLMGMLLRYPYEVRDQAEYFDGIEDVKITKDMLDLARHIVEQKSGHFEPAKFEDHYEAALLDLIEQKKAGHPIAKAKVKTEGNVINLMDALRQSLKGGRSDRPRHGTDQGHSREGQEVKEAGRRSARNVVSDRRQESREGTQARDCEAASQDARRKKGTRGKAQGRIAGRGHAQADRLSTTRP